MSARELGSPCTGTVRGVPVSGWWEGRGVYVTGIEDGAPLDVWVGLSERPIYGRIAGDTGIALKGTYLLDE